MTIILPLAEVLAVLDDGTGIIVQERSIEEWLRDYLPEGTKFAIMSVELEGEEAHVEVNARFPVDAQLVDIKVQPVELGDDAMPGG